MQAPLGKVRGLCLTLEAISFLSLGNSVLPLELQDLMTAQDAARLTAHDQMAKHLGSIASAVAAACGAAMTAITQELEHFAQKQVRTAWGWLPAADVGEDESLHQVAAGQMECSDMCARTRPLDGRTPFHCLRMMLACA